jgi:hypothetical protein
MSPQAAGANARYGYQAETSFAVPPVTPDLTSLYVLEGESLSEKRNLFKSNVIRSNRNPTRPKRGNREVSGSIPTELSPFQGTLLKNIFGSNTTTGAGSNKTHTMKIGALPVGLTIEKGFSDINQFFLYNGCRINKASFEFGTEGIVPMTLDFIGAKSTVSGASFDATLTDLGHDPWDMFECTIQEGGLAIAFVSNVKIDIENELDGGSYVIGGAGVRRAIPEGATLVSGVVTALFEDATLLNKAINYTERALKLTFSRGDGLGTAGNESLELWLPELVYERKDPLISKKGGILIELPFAAYYDNDAAATAAQCLLKNTQATI